MRPPAALARAAGLLAEAESSPGQEGIALLLRDPALLAAHRAMLPPPRRPRIDPLDVPALTGRARLHEADSLQTGWAALAPAERTAVLADATGLDCLVALSGNGRLSSGTGVTERIR